MARKQKITQATQEASKRKPAMKLPPCNPFYRGTWGGSIMSLDGTPTKDFCKKDLAEILLSGDSNEDNVYAFDGQCCGVCRLKDGRFVAWETSYGPTGDGFNKDAYGGDANILVASTLEAAAMLGLTPEARKMCGWKNEEVTNE